MKFLSLFQSAIVYGTIILYGAAGEILTEKSGNLNLGVPGLMSLGAVGGFITARAYEVVYCGSAGISPVHSVADATFCIASDSSFLRLRLAFMASPPRHEYAQEAIAL